MAEFLKKFLAGAALAVPVGCATPPQQGTYRGADNCVAPVAARSEQDQVLLELTQKSPKAALEKLKQQFDTAINGKSFDEWADRSGIKAEGWFGSDHGTGSLIEVATSMAQDGGNLQAVVYLDKVSEILRSFLQELRAENGEVVGKAIDPKSVTETLSRLQAAVDAVKDGIGSRMQQDASASLSAASR